MLNSLRKAALVTGGSRGIGKSIALRLAADGFDVAIGHTQAHHEAQATLAELQAFGVAATAVRGDVSSPLDVDVLFAAAARDLGPLHVVVSNAGVMALSPIAAADTATFDQVIATNLRGSFLVLAKAAQVLGEGARIIALSSSAIAKAMPGYGPYVASKAAVEALIHVLANELRGRNITANAIAPGLVTTDLFLAGKSAEQLRALAHMSPLERLGQPEDIASAVAFLAGAQGGWVNSQVLRVNGGFA